MTEIKAPIYQLLDVMSKLRDPDGGCPWDLEQDFASIAPYTIEEAYEVADAIDRGNHEDIKEELGDLLLQIVFHAQMAKEDDLFTFDDVAQTITDKMIFRHPHVFEDENADSAADVLVKWEQRKDLEKAQKTKDKPVNSSALDDIPTNMPAMLRADKIQKKAVKEGFEWNNVLDVFEKVEEELAELKEAIESGDQDHILEEYGDVLFTVTNIGRKLGLDSEHAMRKTNQKFEKRFRGMEDDCRAEGRTLRDIDYGTREALWNKQKTKST
jgi:MazG family protein|tara:strand:+ start:130083 stop:130889 length:807 start_codon:yes stop_codon:yes gene_type:complete